MRFHRPTVSSSAAGSSPIDRGQRRDAVGGLDPALRQFGAVVLAPFIALDDLRPAVARMLVVQRTGREQRVIEDQEHRARRGQRQPAPVHRNFAMAGLEFLVGEAPGVRTDHDHAARHFLAVMQRLHRERRPDLRNFQCHRRAGVVVHVPEIGADRHRHRDAVAFVVWRAGGVTIRHARQVIADHLLVVFKSAAGQHHALARLDGDRLVASLRPHTEDFLGDIVLDQFLARRFVQHLDRTLLYQPLEQFPGIGIAVGRTIVKLMHAVRARQIGELDADRRMLMLLRIAAQACEPVRCSGTSPRPRPAPCAPARCRVRTRR